MQHFSFSIRFYLAIGLAHWMAPGLTMTLHAESKPNIILMMCDDLGWGDVGFNGNKIIKTPYLDAMAKDGLKFDRFYSAAPVCSPTRGSCLTGRHPFRYGIPFANSGHMKPDEVTLAELLKKQGYRTGHFGKWHLGTLTKTVVEANRGGPRGAEHYSPPQDNGFEVCFSAESKVPTYDPMIKPKGAKAGGHWDAIKEGQETEAYRTHYWNEKGERVVKNLHGANSRVIMDRAIPFIRDAAKNKEPFFAVVWFHTPHLPVVAGPQHRKSYAKYGVHERNYYGCVSAMDEQVGRLRKELAELGVIDNTMHWFCSDNGPEGNASSPGSAGPFRGRKRSLYEGGVRVPGILAWPGRVKAGAVTAFPAVTSDYLPTIAEELGYALPSRPFDGLSLLPFLRGKMKKRPKPIGFESRGKVTLNDNRYKLVTNDKFTSTELYDLEEDPSEKRDLAAEKAEVVKDMIAKLKDWRESCAKSDAGADYLRPRDR
jgi:arylsulfatase A-like enzyme